MDARLFVHFDGQGWLLCFFYTNDPVTACGEHHSLLF